ncbi:hypothetical protein FZEAL_8326 [Fusarium zealandicum]|uniref:Uncharacterized protein n=1 Tax=Fusarium zealandicum TaxID=1053134 RepID=A0A8H4UEQ3_9HYPO|nr:hypothetical protein FZEAL_8326 [Fusarium zealandicum]
MTPSPCSKSDDNEFIQNPPETITTTIIMGASGGGVLVARTPNPESGHGIMSPRPFPFPLVDSPDVIHGCPDNSVLGWVGSGVFGGVDELLRTPKHERPARTGRASTTPRPPSTTVRRAIRGNGCASVASGAAHPPSVPCPRYRVQEEQATGAKQASQASSSSRACFYCNVGE